MELKVSGVQPGAIDIFLVVSHALEDADFVRKVRTRNHRAI
jgi:hypothetical protein